MPPPRPISSPCQSKTLPSLRPKTTSVGNKIPPPRPLKVPLDKLSKQRDGQELRNSETGTVESDTEKKEELLAKTKKEDSAVRIDSSSFKNGTVSKNEPNEESLCAKEVGLNCTKNTVLSENKKEISIIESNKTLPLETFSSINTSCRDETNTNNRIDVQGAIEGEKSSIKQEKERVESNAEVTEEEPQNASLASGKVEHNLGDTKDFKGATGNEKLSVKREKERVELNAEIIAHGPQNACLASGKVERNLGDTENDKGAIENEKLSLNQEKEQVESKAEIIEDDPQNASLASGKVERKFGDDVCESKGAETRDEVDVNVGRLEDELTMLQNFTNKENVLFEHDLKKEENNVEIPEDMAANTNVSKTSFPDNSEESVVHTQKGSDAAATVSVTDKVEEKEIIEPKRDIQDSEKVNQLPNLQAVEKAEETKNEPRKVSESLESENKENFFGDEKPVSERTDEADLLTEPNCRESEVFALKSTEVETEEGESVGNKVLDVATEELNVKTHPEVEQTCHEVTDRGDILITDNLEQLVVTCELKVAVSIGQKEFESGDKPPDGVGFNLDEIKRTDLDESIVQEQELLSEDQVVSNTKISTETKFEADSKPTSEELIFGESSEERLDRPALEESKESLYSGNESEELNYEELVESLEKSEEKAIKKREPSKNEEDSRNLVHEAIDLVHKTKTFKMESSENGKHVNLGGEGWDTLNEKTVLFKTESVNKEKTLTDTLAEKDEEDMKNLVEEKGDSSHNEKVTMKNELVKNEKERKLVVENSDLLHGEKAVESSKLVETEEDMTSLLVKSGDSAHEEKTTETDSVMENDDFLHEQEIVPVSESHKFIEGSEEQETEPTLLNQQQDEIQEDSVAGYLETTEQEIVINMDGSEPVRPVRSKRTKKQQDENEAYEEVTLTDESSSKPRNQRKFNPGYENIVLKPDRRTIDGESVKIPEIASGPTDTNLKSVYYNNVSITSSALASHMVEHVESSESYYNVPVNSSKISTLNTLADHNVSRVSEATLDSDAEYAIPKPHSISVQSDYSIPVAASEIPREVSATTTQSDIEEYAVPKPHSGSFLSEYSVPSNSVEATSQAFGLAGQDVDEELYSIPQTSVTSSQGTLSEPETCMPVDVLYSVPSSQQTVEAKIDSSRSENAARNSASQLIENNTQLSDDNLYSVPLHNSLQVDSQMVSEDYLIPKLKHASALPTLNVVVDDVCSVTQQTQPILTAKPPSKPPRPSLSDESDEKINPAIIQEKETTAYPVPAPRLSSSPKSVTESPESKPRKLPPGARPVFPVASPRLVRSTVINKTSEKTPETKNDQSFAPSPRPRSKVIRVEEYVYSPSRKSSSGQLPIPAKKAEHPKSRETQGSVKEVSSPDETSIHERPRSSIFYTKSPKRRAPPPPRPPPPSEKRLSQISDSDSCSGNFCAILVFQVCVPRYVVILCQAFGTKFMFYLGIICINLKYLYILLRNQIFFGSPWTKFRF